jgi:YggT family protein
LNFDIIVRLIDQFFFIYWLLLLIYILSSWIPPLRESRIGDLLGAVCEPYLAPFRRILPTLGGLDLSPILALIALNFIEAGLIYALELLFG